jgi:hypothetical protein
MAESGVVEGIKPTPVIDWQPLAAEVNLLASKKEKRNKETGEILPGSVENTPQPTTPTGNASLVFNGQPLTLQQYARLGKTKGRIVQEKHAESGLQK